MSSFITGTASFLPNRPVDNAQIESFLGMLDGVPSSVKDLVLERNGIRWRYYAIAPDTRELTHTNVDLTVEAIRRLLDSSGVPREAIDLLACGTSSPDQMVPSHAAMVHGKLGNPACEILSSAGVCCSSMIALRHAQYAVESGHACHAVVAGSELASASLRAIQFPRLPQGRVVDNPFIGFSQEFLRFMLSDGAGTVLVQPQPVPGKPCLRIDWLDIRSFANEIEACMYSGALKLPDGSLKGWRQEEAGLPGVLEKGYLALSQDVKLLGDEIVGLAGRFFAESCRRHGVRPGEIRWLLPHLSSMFFQQPLYDEMERHGVTIPLERWFTNLKYKGNTGSASMFIILDELVRSGKLQAGDRLLCVVPESARFTFACMHATVAADG
jgi:3-oxoacyl-[acyl-carrier-protein] synthase-3